MKFFGIGEIARIRLALSAGAKMERLCFAFSGAHDRDEIVEVVDAIRRHASDHDAQRHVNQVLAAQEAGVPLVNGRAASAVFAPHRPAAMF